jgi:flagellar biosynthesis/type III secretory pathway M-ring protein FliF/YscJ
MDVITFAFYAILFIIAFMIARIIMKIMRGY